MRTWARLLVIPAKPAGAAKAGAVRHEADATPQQFRRGFVGASVAVRTTPSTALAGWRAGARPSYRGRPAPARHFSPEPSRRGRHVPVGTLRRLQLRGGVQGAGLPHELFGYVRGAFTGAATEGRLGRFELAHGGTLCLDEIGELPLDLQPYLLRVLEEGIVYRVGDSEPRHVNVRLIAMTNRNLRDEVAAGRFRQDLYYRIGVTTVRIPPFRERTGDTDLLVPHFNELLSRRHDLTPKQFDAAVLEAFRHHDWPGNVRELRNVIEACR